MSRLRYSAKGFIRSLQVSRANLFAFVEGWSDRYFYDRICDLSCHGTGLVYELRTAQELPSQAGGKKALLRFFSNLRRRKLLFHEFKGKTLAIIIFLDKDVDDVLGTRKRSRHIIYTEYYHLENHLLRFTDLCEVGAAAASLDVKSVRSTVGDQEPWMLRAATEWKEWVKLCVTAQFLHANCRCTYSLPSQINDGPYGGIIPASLAALATDLQSASGLSQVQFQELRERVSRRVDRIYDVGRHNTLFKGNWYPIFLAEDLHRAADGRPYNKNGAERVCAIANAKLDFGQNWAAYFLNRVTAIVQMVHTQP